jgi:4-alpha-glucanotransferase
MNLPNSTQGNWSWRFNEQALTESHAQRLRDMTETYGRIRKHEVESMKLDQETV